MEKVQQILNENKHNYNHEFFEELDKRFSFGIDATTPSKTIFKSKKAITLGIRVTRVDYAHVMVCMPISQWETLTTATHKKTYVIKQMVMHNKTTQEVYIKGIGYCEEKDVDFSQYHVCDTDDKDKDADTKEAYKYRVKNLQKICDIYDINASQYSYSDTLIARMIAHKTFKYLRGAEHVDQRECKLLEGATRGAINFAKKEVITDCYDYDVNSMYPFLLMDSKFSQFTFPLCKPQYVEFKNKPNGRGPKLEIYHLKINGNHDYFRTTPDNRYNTYHVRLLVLLDIDFEVVTYTKAVYDHCVKASDIFGYLKPVYDMKKNGNTCAKPILNNTWGVLGRAKDFEVPFEDLQPWHVKNIVSTNIARGYVTLRDKARPFRHLTGRLKSFLLAHARWFLVYYMLQPLEEEGFKIYQCNTDGFITDATPAQMNDIYTISTEMGHLKLVKKLEGKHDIKHVRRIDKVVDEQRDDDDCFNIDDDE